MRRGQRLVLVEARDETRNPERDRELAARLVAAARAERDEKVGVMLPSGILAAQGFAGAEIYPWGTWGAPETLAQSLYAGLRALDAAGCTVILCPLPPAEGIGVAIRDRLLKAGTRD